MSYNRIFRAKHVLRRLVSLLPGHLTVSNALLSFGGPMLNILLGIGGAGTYVILSTGHSYPVHFSPTLWVSAIGLICLLCITLVFIPFNNYCISRKWAIFLFSFYISLTVVNIIVEVKGIRI
jgi:sodium/potassium/calcium exchanger 6